jgi:hypothetical protein
MIKSRKAQEFKNFILDNETELLNALWDSDNMPESQKLYDRNVKALSFMKQILNEFIE